MDVLNQINTENAMAEEIRQFNQNYQFQVQQFEEQKRQYEQEYQESVRQFNEEIARLKAKDAEENKREIQRLELQKQQLAEEKRQYEASLKLQQQQLAEEKRQFDASLAEEQRQYNASLAAKTSGKIKSSGDSGSSDNSGSISGSSSKAAVNTAYYSGPVNADANKYGTFSNGYQPRGVGNQGTLHKTGEKISIETVTKYGQKQIVVQNVWETNNGNKWYWEGRENRYIQIK
jgi:hypothetical protein